MKTVDRNLWCTTQEIPRKFIAVRASTKLTERPGMVAHALICIVSSQPGRTMESSTVLQNNYIKKQNPGRTQIKFNFNLMIYFRLWKNKDKSNPETLNEEEKKNEGGSWRDGSAVEGISGDPSSVPITHTGWLIIACNSSSRRSYCLFDVSAGTCTHMAYTHIKTYTYTEIGI